MFQLCMMLAGTNYPKFVEQMRISSEMIKSIEFLLCNFWSTSKPILFTILFNTLDFPSSFVNEYMRLQPLLRVKLEKQSFLRNSNLRPDSCFEGFFKICMGFFVVLMAWINDRLHGILLLGVYCFDFYEFYMNLPDNSYHVKSRNSSGTTSSSSSAVSDSCNSSGTSRESVYCCPHKYRNR